MWGQGSNSSVAKAEEYAYLLPTLLDAMKFCTTSFGSFHSISAISSSLA